jgi:hypothetical protein
MITVHHICEFGLIYNEQVKSDGYKRTRKTRVFLCAASPDESGQEALEWALESLVQDDDEFVVVRGFDAGELGMLPSCPHC